MQESAKEINKRRIQSLDPANFFLNVPLYNLIIIDDVTKDYFEELMRFDGKIEGYNPFIKDNTTYRVYSSLQPRHLPDAFFIAGGTNVMKFVCARTSSNFYVYVYYNVKDQKFYKIGQFPSIADFHIAQIKDYSKVIPIGKETELTKAIGLAANGVGIGSFVYLRRVFESLIQEAHVTAKSKQDWNEEKYKQSRMVERIELLHNHLPTFLVENRKMYAIMSEAIHSLSEDQCLSLYEPIRMGIEIILDERLERFKEQQKKDKATKVFSEYQSKANPTKPNS